MKKIALIIMMAFAVCVSVEAKKMSDLTIVIDPGHGGYEGDDRGMNIWPYCAVVEESMWESKSNLWKGLHLKNILDSLGTKITLTREHNNYTDGENPEPSLSARAQMANSRNADMFISIHSNAGENVNYPLEIYHQETSMEPRSSESVRMSEVVKEVFNTSEYSNWVNYKGQINTTDAGRVTGDRSLLGYSLGVLRNCYQTSMLSEGGMHEHRPQAHRLMSDDYCWLEAWYFAKAIMIFFDTEDRFVTGNIAGVIYDNHNIRNWEYTGEYARHTMLGRDKYMPVNGAYVELVDAEGNVLQTRTTDIDYNGVYVFRNVQPGTYTVRTSHNNYYTSEKQVTVVADEVSYEDFPVVYKRDAPLKIVSYTPAPAEGELVSCASSINFEFNWDVDVDAFEKAFSIEPAVEGYFTYQKSYRIVSFIPNVGLTKNTNYTVKVDKSACTTDTIYSHPQMEEDFVLNFTTQDRERILITDQYPQEGGTVHLKAPSLEFRFDRTLNGGTATSSTVAVYDSDNNKLSFKSRTGIKTNALAGVFGNLVLTMASDLTVGEEYRVVLSGGGVIRDADGLPLVEDYEVKFTATDESANATGDLFENFETASLFAYNVDETVGSSTTTPKYIKNTTDKLFDTACGKFTYAFESNRDGVIVWDYAGTEEKQVVKGDKLGFYVYGDFNNHELYVGVTSGTDVKYEKICDLNFRGWKYFEVQMNSLELSETVPYYVLSKIKLVQVTSPITQTGGFSLDNMMKDSTVGIEDVIADEKSEIKIFPNPASDVINVQSPVDINSLEIINIRGVKVAEVNNANSIAVDHLHQGVYFVKVKTAQGDSTHRIAISR